MHASSWYHHEILVDFCIKLQGTVEPVDADIRICLSSEHKTPCAASGQMEPWLALWCRLEGQDRAAGELPTWDGRHRTTDNDNFPYEHCRLVLMKALHKLPELPPKLGLGAVLAAS